MLSLLQQNHPSQVSELRGLLSPVATLPTHNREPYDTHY